MADALGQELLIDLYDCLEEVVTSPDRVRRIIATALEAAEREVDDITSYESENETAVLAVGDGYHLAVHVYPGFGYVSADIYAFKSRIKTTLIMKELKRAFGARRVKATSVKRGDFGSQLDMKPRAKTTLTVMGRMTRTRTRLKKTGSRLKSTGAKVFRVIAKRKKKPQAQQTPPSND